MCYQKEIRRIIAKVTDRQTAISIINDLYGWKNWYVDFQDYREECVPSLLETSDEIVMYVARQQLLLDSSDYLEHLFQEDFV